MLAFAKKIAKKLKWNPAKNMESKTTPNSYLLTIFIKLLEDALYWKKTWLSLIFVLYLNVIIFVCSYWEIKFLEFVLKFFIAVIIADALELWLIYKHRTSFLKQLATQDEIKLFKNVLKLKIWIKNQWRNYIYLRETNHAKAFLLGNIAMGLIFAIGKCISGYFLLYLLCMLAFTFKIIGYHIHIIFKKIQQNAESDGEIDSLIPEVSERDMKELCFDPQLTKDEKQTLDFWKPEDMAIDDVSDSSENSSSIVTNLSMEKLPKDVETSDSSDEEYIPIIGQKEQFQTTLEEVEPAGNWGDSAYNVLRNISGAVASVYTTSSPTQDKKRKRVSSVDSSDGFEIIDKNDL